MRFYFASAMAMMMSVGALSPAAGADYDPLRVEQPKPQYHDFTVHDDARSRDIPIRVYLPTTSGPAPVVLFSHGLGGSRRGIPIWANIGLVVGTWLSMCSIRAATIACGRVSR